MQSLNSVSIVSFNILSEALGKASYYCFSDAADCDPNVRLKRVLLQLKAHMGSDGNGARSVICLQEVSRTWGAALVPFWEDNGYGHVAALSGPQANNYMGQVIAWPRDLFSLQDCDVVRVADTAEWPAEVTNRGTGKEHSKGKIQRQRGHKEFDVWKEVKRRHNCVALVRLVPRLPSVDPLPFAVGTYHMPCLFGSNAKCQVMVAHAALVFAHAQRFADGAPLVVAGAPSPPPQSPPALRP
jgi:2',5'-phosphodiesterase